MTGRHAEQAGAGPDPDDRDRAASGDADPASGRGANTDDAVRTDDDAVRTDAGSRGTVAGPGNRSGGPWVTGLVLVLCALLGFGLATQVRRTASGDALSDLRPDDLVQILDGLQQREDELNDEIAGLEVTLRRLRAGGASSGQALQEAQRQVEQLSILAGTVPAHGPGVTIRIDDPATSIAPEVLLDLIQELRNAGAEAMQVGDIRIGMNSAFTGSNTELVLDGTVISQPFVVTAIGDPPTLAAALAIPGGVTDTVRRTGAEISVTQADSVVIDALRPELRPQYARSGG